jgi:hypothetical protein
MGAAAWAAWRGAACAVCAAGAAQLAGGTGCNSCCTLWLPIACVPAAGPAPAPVGPCLLRLLRRVDPHGPGSRGPGRPAIGQGSLGVRLGQRHRGDLVPGDAGRVDGTGPRARWPSGWADGVGGRTSVMLTAGSPEQMGGVGAAGGGGRAAAAPAGARRSLLRHVRRPSLEWDCRRVAGFTPATEAGAWQQRRRGPVRGQGPRQRGARPRGGGAPAASCRGAPPPARGSTGVRGCRGRRRRRSTRGHQKGRWVWKGTLGGARGRSARPAGPKTVVSRGTGNRSKHGEGRGGLPGPGLCDRRGRRGPGIADAAPGAPWIGHASHHIHQTSRKSSWRVGSERRNTPPSSKSAPPPP